MKRAFDYDQTIGALHDAIDELQTAQDTLPEETIEVLDTHVLRCTRCATIERVDDPVPCTVQLRKGDWRLLCTRCATELREWLKG